LRSKALKGCYQHFYSHFNNNSTNQIQSKLQSDLVFKEFYPQK